MSTSRPTTTVTVQTFDGTMDVPLTAPTREQAQSLISLAPTHDDATTEELLSWGGVLVARSSELTTEEVMLFSVEAMGKLTEAACNLLKEAYGDERLDGGDTASEFLVDTDDGDPFAAFDLDENGALDPEDYR